MDLLKLAGQCFHAEKTIREWWGDGGHPDPKAQDRADVCTGRLTGKPCPYNYHGRWLFPKAVADAIRRCFEIKSHAQLTVTGEENLGQCECCNCVLSLKVHTPLTHILNTTNPRELEKFPEWCWIKTEMKESPPK